jgi:ATP-binding cassette subfamily F protein 3
LSKLMLAGNNLMLLDEPTNHLDMPSKEVLEQALEDYDGTLLIISHDRYFLNKIVDRIFLFEKNGITEYLGNYDDFLEKRRNEEIMASLKEKAPVGMTKTGKQENKKKEREERQKRRAYQQLLENLEEKIQSLEEAVKMLEEQLTDPELYKDIDRMLSVQEKYNQTKASLDQAYQKWMDHQL